MDQAFSSPADASRDSTSSSLIQRAKARETEAWNRLVQLYGPLVYHWATMLKLQHSDAADVVQETFQSVAVHLAEFRRDRPGDSFRGWLWTISRNKIRDHFRRLSAGPLAWGGSDALIFLQQAPDAPPEDALDPGRRNEKTALLHRALKLIEGEFEPRTWEAFRRTTVEGHAPADVAQDLGLSVASVYQAKSRVLRRLREEFEELIE